GIHFLDLLGHETELRDAFAIKLLLVTESNGLEREDRFARLTHWLDRLFVTTGRHNRAEATISADDDRDSIGHSRSANAGNIRRGVNLRRTNVDGIALGRDTRVPEIDIVVTVRQVSTRLIAECGVRAASR